MPAFVAQQGMPYWLDLLSSDVRKSAHFYSEVFGWEFEETVPGYRLARMKGLPVAGIIAQPEEATMPDTWITHFLADDVDALVAKVEELGGRILSPVSEVQLGRMALCVDTAGAVFGLIEPAFDEAFVAGGEPGTAVWHQLEAVSKYDAAVDFYANLFDWDLMRVDTEDFGYATAVLDGAGFAGISNAKDQFPPSVPSFWNSIVGCEELGAAVDSARAAGGDLIVDMGMTDFGRVAVLEDSTGASVMICEVDEPVEEGHEGDPLAGVDLSQFGFTENG